MIRKERIDVIADINKGIIIIVIIERFIIPVVRNAVEFELLNCWKNEAP